jgi:hypothetical protein
MTNASGEVAVTRSSVRQYAALRAVAAALGMTIGSLFAASAAPERVVVRRSERKRLSPRRGITYDL